MKDRIVTVGHTQAAAVLRKKLPPLALERERTGELRDLVRTMRAVMKSANGVGLSANQIGLTERLFVAQVPDREGRQRFYAIVNPTITKTSPETVSVEEGCLSVPHQYGIVERPARVTLEGHDIRGKKIKIRAWGLLARVFQHEVDHLDGKLFTDHSKDLRPRGQHR